MVDLGQDREKSGRWVCPDDRQLALRAKLSTGWCMKAHDMTHYNSKVVTLNDQELSIIKDIIHRADEMELREQERVGRLVDVVHQLKKNMLGDGIQNCILCGEVFRFFGDRGNVCRNCTKKMCHKCGITVPNSSGGFDWLCKVCFETKEMWKKTGGWFTRTLPIHKLPEPKVRPPKTYHTERSFSTWSTINSREKQDEPPRSQARNSFGDQNWRTNYQNLATIGGSSKSLQFPMPCEKLDRSLGDNKFPRDISASRFNLNA